MRRYVYEKERKNTQPGAAEIPSVFLTAGETASRTEGGVITVETFDPAAIPSFVREEAEEDDVLERILREIDESGWPDTKTPSSDGGNPAADTGSGAGSDTGSGIVADIGSGIVADPSSDAVITAMQEGIAAQFDFDAPFYGGFARVGRRAEDGRMKYFFINGDGEVISNEYDTAMDFVGGVAIVGNRMSLTEYSTYNMLYGYIDTTGQEIIPLTWRGGEFGVRPYYFYNGLAEVTWYEENDQSIVYTNLIDMTGTKQLPADIPCVNSWGYGGWDEPRDFRLLYLTTSRDSAPDGWPFYAEWNIVQEARLQKTVSWPIPIYDRGNTLLLDENLNVISSEPGYKVKLDKRNGLYIRYPSSEDTQLGALVDAAGNVLIENIKSAAAGAGDEIIVTFPDNSPKFPGSVYALYSRNGERLSDDFPGLKTWASGYIIQKDRPQKENANCAYIVTDADLNELFTIQAQNLYQVKESYGLEGAGKPLFYRSYYEEGSTDPVEYLDLSGQAVFPYEPDTQLRLLTSEYVVRQRPDGLEIYSLDGRSVSVMPGVQNLYSTWTRDGSQLLFCYRMIEDVQNDVYAPIYVRMDEENGTLSFTEVPYNPEIGLISPASDSSEEVILLENGYCALWGTGADENFNFTPPVTLKIGSKEIARSTALSLIGNNLYKQGTAPDDQSTRITGVSLHTADGSWQSDVYEEMGYLSCNHISFLKNGKWGYLTVVP